MNIGKMSSRSCSLFKVAYKIILTKPKIANHCTTMTSAYTLLGYTDYRFLGKKLYRLGHYDKRGRFFAMREIKLVYNNGSYGYFLSNKSGKKFFSQKKIRETGMLVKEKMKIKEIEKGQPV